MIGSGLGEAIPANRNTQKIMTRRHFLNRAWVKMPTRLSITRKSGTSKHSPKPEHHRDA